MLHATQWVSVPMTTANMPSTEALAPQWGTEPLAATANKY